MALFSYYLFCERYVCFNSLVNNFEGNLWKQSLALEGITQNNNIVHKISYLTLKYLANLVDLIELNVNSCKVPAIK